MNPKRFATPIGLVAGVLALSTTMVACGSSDDDTNDAAACEDVTPREDNLVTLGILPAWTDGLSVGYLWKNVLESEGYEVEITEVQDAAPLYTGVANGDVDIYPSAWPEVTHAQYMEKYGDDLEDLGAYYENAKLTLAVPEYTDIDSIADLAENVDMFDGRIVGIEPGAGLTDATENSVMPTYGLDEYELITSSTTAMLAELQNAIDAGEDIVVTLWRPFWANSAFPVKDLEDPEGALGEPETLNAIATKCFSEEMPEVAELFENFALDDEAYGDLESTVTSDEYEGDPAGAVAAWLAERPDFIDNLKNG